MNQEKHIRTPGRPGLVLKKLLSLCRNAFTAAGRGLRLFALAHRQLSLSLAVLLLGAAATFTLVKLRKPPARTVPEKPAPLVEVQPVQVRDVQVVVKGFGTVTPKVEVQIVPQVSGKVVWMNPNLTAGGFIRAYEEIFRIEPRDYELAVQQAQALVADAQVKLDLEKAEAEVAVREWKQLHPDSEPTSPLVLREPQIRKAEAALESARAQLSVAKLSLERTRVSLPIDVRIVSESVDLGQYVIAGQPVGQAYGMDAVEIRLPLEDKELAWFDIPGEPALADGNAGPAERTMAEVTAEFAGAVHTWTGYVARTVGQVDKVSRMVTVVVEVPNPFDTSGGKVALLPGTFVEVAIKGKLLRNAVVIPRYALRQDNSVWLVNGDRLRIQPLKVARADTDFVYATGGVPDGALLVTSSLDVVTDGMEVRTQMGLAKSGKVQPDVNQPDYGEAD